MKTLSNVRKRNKTRRRQQKKITEKQEKQEKEWNALIKRTIQKATNSYVAGTFAFLNKFICFLYYLGLRLLYGEADQF